MVYVLQHECESEPGVDEVKLIGVYSTRDAAAAAAARLRAKPGFSEHPDGFTIDEYELDRNHWTDGFFRAD